MLPTEVGEELAVDRVRLQTLDFLADIVVVERQSCEVGVALRLAESVEDRAAAAPALAENLRDAVATVKDSIAFPAVLGRICPKPCEKGCRRGAADGSVAVCQLKRFVADADLAYPLRTSTDARR